MIQVIAENKVKVRKPRQCFSCLRKFPVGTTMHRQVNNYEGDIGSVYSCETCDTLMKTFRIGFDDSENIFPEGAVCESLEKGQTPEQLLETLKLERV